MPLLTVAGCYDTEELIISNQFNMELHKSQQTLKLIAHIHYGVMYTVVIALLTILQLLA